MELKISTDELRKAKIMVASPMYGGENSGIMNKSLTTLAQMTSQHGIHLEFYYLFNESLITRARNYCVDAFLRSTCTHLVFIDSDIGFHPHDLLALVALQMRDPENYNIICGPYPKKNISWEKIVRAVKNGIADEDPNNLANFVGDFVFNPVRQGAVRLDEPIEVLESGTGFMCVPRATFEKFEKAAPYYKYLPDHVRSEHFDGSREIMQYFQAEIDGPTAEENLLPSIANALANDDNIEVALDCIREAYDQYMDEKNKSSKRYLSEDYWFCQKARKFGMKIWLCPWMQLHHMGSYIYSGSIPAMASIGASATADATSNPNYYKKKDNQNLKFNPNPGKMSRDVQKRKEKRSTRRKQQTKV